MQMPDEISEKEHAESPPEAEIDKFTLSARENDNEGDGSEAIDIAPYLYPIASFLLPLAVYWRTMCPALYIGDCGDFITASHTLGVPHPPGYPLYTLLGKLFLMIPLPGGLSWAAWRMNFMSAFFGALTTLVVYFFILRISKRGWLSFFAALAVGFGQTFWSQAVVAEVYSLNTFFMMLQLYLLHVRATTQSKNSLIWLGLILGLSLSHHPSIAIFFPLYICYSVVHHDHPMTRLLIFALAIGMAIINPWGLIAIVLFIPHELFVVMKYKSDNLAQLGKGFGIALLLFFLMLLFYIYLPAVGYKNPVTDRMEFKSIKANAAYFVETVSRSIYQYRAYTPGEKLTTTPMVLKRYFQILWGDYSALSLIFFAGIFAFLRRDRMAWMILGCYLIFMAIVLFFPSGDILRAALKNLEVVMPPLMIPAQLTLILFGFIGVAHILDWLPQYVESMREVDPMPPQTKMKILSGVVMLAIGILVLVLIPFNNWRFCDKSKDLIAWNYARNVIISTPPNSFVLNTGDETFLFWYIQKVENFMPEKNICFENWIHNIRDYSVLKNEEQAIREVLLWVLKNREWAVTDPEFKLPDHRIPKPGHRVPGYDHWCSAFLTDYIQKDPAFASQDAHMHGLIYELDYKPPEYYKKYGYSIDPEKGIIKTSKGTAGVASEPPNNAADKDKGSDKTKKDKAGKVPGSSTEAPVKQEYLEGYFEDDYPGMRLILDGDIPYNEFHWEGLFNPVYGADNKVESLEYDKSYKDPQEEEIIGRYQEMFHNIGSWNIFRSKDLKDKDRDKAYVTATQAFQLEVKLKPSDPIGWLSLGNAYLQMRLISQAIDAIKYHVQWTELNPSSTLEQRARSHYFLSLAYFIAGEFSNALDEIDQSLLMNTTDKEASSLREEILSQWDMAKKKARSLKEELNKKDESQPKDKETKGEKSSEAKPADEAKKQMKQPEKSASGK